MKKWYALQNHKQQHTVDVHKDWEWNEATAEMVLAKLRWDVLRELANVARDGGLSVASREPDVGGMAWLLAVKIESSGEGDVGSHAKQADEVASGELPVYDLKSMLGDAATQAFARANPELVEDSYIMVEMSASTTALQLALMQLAGFMSRSSEMR